MFPIFSAQENNKSIREKEISKVKKPEQNTKDSDNISSEVPQVENTIYNKIIL